MSTMKDLRGTDDWDGRRIALVVVAVALVSWAGYLSFALPTSYTVSSWSLAWAGFDVLVAGLLAATGWLALRRRPEVVLSAVAAAGVLGADAWFDVATANSGDRLASVLSAVLVELPLATALVVAAARRVHELATATSIPIPVPRAGTREGSPSPTRSGRREQPHDCGGHQDEGGDHTQRQFHRGPERLHVHG